MIAERYAMASCSAVGLGAGSGVTEGGGVGVAVWIAMGIGDAIAVATGVGVAGTVAIGVGYVVGVTRRRRPRGWGGDSLGLLTTCEQHTHRGRR